MKYEFVKMQASGNDYIYFDCFNQEVFKPEKLARCLSRRHFSVGSDGIVLILPSEGVDAKMRMFNADGSEGLTCGNALRCVGKLLFEKFPERKELTVKTAASVSKITRSGDGIRATVGPYKVYPFSKKIVFGKNEFVFTPVSVGNFHAVAFCFSPEESDLEKVGPFVAQNPIFERQPNVEFAEIRDGGAYMRVWERGSGETLSCSSGAAAVAAVCEKNGIIKKGEIFKITTSGGVTFTEVFEREIAISGDAHTVFTGVFDSENI